MAVWYRSGRDVGDGSWRERAERGTDARWTLVTSTAATTDVGRRTVISAGKCVMRKDVRPVGLYVYSFCMFYVVYCCILPHQKLIRERSCRAAGLRKSSVRT